MAVIFLSEGLLDEASSLLDSGLQPNSNSASRSIGYQLVRFFLQGYELANVVCHRFEFLCVSPAVYVHY